MRNYHPNDDIASEKERLFYRAWGYSQLDMHKEALAECKKLIRLDPDDASSYIELGIYYEKNREIEKATSCYKNMMKRFPENSQCYVNLGYIFETHKKRNDMAMACYEKALELNPRSEWALNNIGIILQKEGKRKDALHYHERAYEASKLNGKADSWILHNVAWAYYRCKNYSKATAIYQKLADDKEYANAAVFYDFGCVSYKTGAYNRALRLFEKALLLCPDNRYYRWGCQVAGKKIG